MAFINVSRNINVEQVSGLSTIASDSMIKKGLEPPFEAGGNDSRPPSDSKTANSKTANSIAEVAKTKKKKKKKSSGKNKKPTPSGFEEFYADAPVTPAEYEEETQHIYNSSRSFVERIEQCIQRYRARRKFGEKRANVFNKYLTLGGIDTSLKAFNGGLDKATLEDSNAAEIAAFQATDRIGGHRNSKFYDPSDNANWVVDFEGVAKSFLSHRAPNAFGFDSEKEIFEYCDVIRNFLSYVLVHDVCPEYTKEVIAARAICDLAQNELWAIKQLGRLLPGSFNKAASTLYGGYYKGLSNTDYSWTGDLGPPSAMSVANANRNFMAAVSWVGNKEHFDNLTSKSRPVEVIRSEARSMEVVKITMPTEEIKVRFARTKDAEGQVGNIKPIGLLEVKQWNNPEADNEDLTEEEEQEIMKNGHHHVPNETFWIEGEALEHCFIGMKFEATVRELNIGVKYFDTIAGVYCSFFTILPNDLMDGWKEPVPNPRAGPTVDDFHNPEDNVDEKDVE